MRKKKTKKESKGRTSKEKRESQWEKIKRMCTRTAHAWHGLMDETHHELLRA